jgi:hypothetical protein
MGGEPLLRADLRGEKGIDAKTKALYRGRRPKQRLKPCHGSRGGQVLSGFNIRLRPMSQDGWRVVIKVDDVQCKMQVETLKRHDDASKRWHGKGATTTRDGMGGTEAEESQCGEYWAGLMRSRWSQDHETRG